MEYQKCNRCQTSLLLDESNFRYFKTGKWSKHCNKCRDYFKTVVESPAHHKRRYRKKSAPQSGSFENIDPQSLNLQPSTYTNTAAVEEQKSFSLNHDDFPLLK